ncbi:hypothetical protein H8356DRAFT_1428973 [Neocallimastix lanati (nom. inval.)]|nr:hypothetical protein H8356DRAFT_1428973 [Neocallimastix sp. JGI-2020a]
MEIPYIPFNSNIYKIIPSKFGHKDKVPITKCKKDNTFHFGRNQGKYDISYIVSFPINRHFIHCFVPKSIDIPQRKYPIYKGHKDKVPITKCKKDNTFHFGRNQGKYGIIVKFPNHTLFRSQVNRHYTKESILKSKYLEYLKDNTFHFYRSLTNMNIKKIIPSKFGNNIFHFDRNQKNMVNRHYTKESILKSKYLEYQKENTFHFYRNLTNMIIVQFPNHSLFRSQVNRHSTKESNLKNNTFHFYRNLSNMIIVQFPNHTLFRSQVNRHSTKESNLKNNTFHSIEILQIIVKFPNHSLFRSQVNRHSTKDSNLKSKYLEY